jgi:hypothetical protein
MAGIERLGHQRQASADLVRTPELRVDAIELHRVGQARGDLKLGGRVRNIEDAALTQHHVEIEFARQPLIEPERQVVEGDRLGIEVVRPHDGGVAAGVAAAEPALLDHADARAFVGLGEVISGRQPMSAAADNDEVINPLGFRLAPGLRPAFVSAEALAQEGEGRIAPAHATTPKPPSDLVLRSAEGASRRTFQRAQPEQPSGSSFETPCFARPSG